MVTLGWQLLALCLQKGIPNKFVPTYVEKKLFQARKKVVLCITINNDTLLCFVENAGVMIYYFLIWVTRPVFPLAGLI